MKISSITIVLSLDDHDNPSHAQEIAFSNGMWSADGPMYSRLAPALHEVWRILRTATKGDTMTTKERK